MGESCRADTHPGADQPRRAVEDGHQIRRSLRAAVQREAVPRAHARRQEARRRAGNRARARNAATRVAASAAEPGAEQIAQNAAREDLAKLLSAEEERDARAEYLLRGAPSGAGDAIVACAQELAVELVVMGKHRQGFVDHLVAGSVAEKVIRRAPCPVLIVHHPEHDFVADDR